MPLTPQAVFGKKRKREKIIALTAYDFPFAKVLDQNGVDVILVGDSLGMVLLGFESTLPVTMEHMLHHTAAVARAVKNALVVGDMPNGSYKTPAQAVKNAKLFLKAGARAVKLEGGKSVEKQIRALVKAKIPVMGHLGMLPQSVKKMGGYKVQGKTPEDAARILLDAKILEKLGVFAAVVECVPSSLARMITSQVKYPTIGIGAGADTDGQILVLHDMLGFESGIQPRFVRRYAQIGREAAEAVAEYREDVLAGKFPSAEESY
jgi:3-methyl-2-oxobutanoate hydroxymethyltransferase